MTDDTRVFDVRLKVPSTEHSGAKGVPTSPAQASQPDKSTSLPTSFDGSRYELRRLLGQGGMGKVYQAADRERGGELVAIKVLAPLDHDDPLALTRFQRELDAMRDCRHENIVRILDAGRNRLEQYFIAMEYVSGGTLAERIQDANGPQPFEETLRILHAVADGIAHAHSQDIVHRDLKPANILLGPGGTIKVTDFGMARHTTPGMTITEAETTLGTPEYMSPEQFQSSHVGKPADIYALGLIAYELAKGERPYPPGLFIELANAHICMPMPKLDTRELGIPKWFGTFVALCTQKTAEDRYGSMDEVLKTLTGRMRKMKLLDDGQAETPPLWSRIGQKLLGLD